MIMKLLLCWLLVLLPLHYSEALDCTGLPSDSLVAAKLQTLVDSEGGEGGATITVQDGPYYTCQVQGTTMGTYQELSIIMTYTVPGSNDVRVRQFEMDCIEVGGNNVWDRRPSSLNLVSNSVDYMNIEVMTSCSECTIDAGNDHHCEACNSACNSGLRRCTGSSSSDCCVAFEDDGVCSLDLNCNKNNFVANEQNNYTCACELACADGYTFNSTLCSCQLDSICLADNPCANNGMCVLGSSPDQYTCNCTGTNYMGTNCSDEIPVPTTTSQSTATSTDGGVGQDVTSSATPTNTMGSCNSNCSVCDNGCCTDCVAGLDVDQCGCVSLLPPRCEIFGCKTCRSPTCCSECEEGYETDSNDECRCVDNRNPGSSSTSSGRSTSTGRGPSSTGKTDRSSGDLEGSDIIAIIVSSVLGLLMLMVLVVAIFYVVYYFWAGGAIAASKAKLEGPFMQGSAYDNPMYLDPELVAS